MKISITKWFFVKIGAVTFLILFQVLLNYWRKQLKLGKYQGCGTFFRIINEIPTLLLIIILVSVVFKKSF